MFGKIQNILYTMGATIIAIGGVFLFGKRSGKNEENNKQNKKLLDAVRKKNTIRNRNRAKYNAAKRLRKSRTDSDR